MFAKKKPLTDQEIIAALISLDSSRVKDWYNENFITIQKLVLTHNGTTEDVKDLYHNAVLSVIKNLKDGKFKCNSSLNTYLYRIARNLWFFELRDRGNWDSQTKELQREVTANFLDDMDTDYATQIQKQLFSKHLKRLPEDCQTILQMYCEGKSDSEASTKLQEPSIRAIVQRRSRCKFNLLRLVRNDPMYKEVFEYEQD